MIHRMKFLLAVVLLATAKGSKDANSSNLNMVLVKALQGQLKTCMDQNRDLVQRSCQKPGHWGGRGGKELSHFESLYSLLVAVYTNA